MRAHRSSARFLILLCFFALQMQLFASAAMACKHAGPADGASYSACPVHKIQSSTLGADDQGLILDCQKCVLGLVFGGCHGTMPGLVTGPAENISEDPSIRFKHFYHFVPDRLFRPPISLLS